MLVRKQIKELSSPRTHTKKGKKAYTNFKNLQIFSYVNQILAQFWALCLCCLTTGAKTVCCFLKD